ncbi:MAG: pyridoxamine 5'-phosphate oxidase [Planctomycetaceae bacterium]
MLFDQMRRAYQLNGLADSDALDDPLAQFRQWFDEAVTGDVPPWLEVNAMTLSTASSDGRVTSRIVLLKGLDEAGRFLFFTNYNSAKGKQIAENPAVSLCFFWPHLERQVRICGRAEKTSRDTSRTYFHSRPRGSQLGAILSEQSSPIASREVLEQALNQRAKELEGQEIPCPEDWGGYAVTPHEIEFWQGRDNRLHDRIAYRREGQAWVRSRLAP